MIFRVDARGLAFAAARSAAVAAVGVDGYTQQRIARQESENGADGAHLVAVRAPSGSSHGCGNHKGDYGHCKHADIECCRRRVCVDDEMSAFGSLIGQHAHARAP